MTKNTVNGYSKRRQAMAYSEMEKILRFAVCCDFSFALRKLNFTREWSC
ncbi:MAG: hypothetical protein ACI4JJ_06640 [Huintestinicola sp.]